MASQHQIGEQGEKIAARYLTGLGYKIRERNWHFGHSEIDIIAVDGEELVIVEVKSRTGDRYEHPSEAVSKQKIRHIIEAAEGYIQLHEIDMDTRFDVVTVIFYGQEYELEHFKDAFYPMM